MVAKGLKVLAVFIAFLPPALAQPSPKDEGSLQAWLWEVAKRTNGYPYLWGGSGYGGFDCSGLVVYVYRHLGISLPRTSREQYQYLPKVREQIRPGDLLFFSASRKQIDHVAIYLGNGYMLHAYGVASRVQVDPWTRLKDIYVGAARPLALAQPKATPVSYRSQDGRP